METQIIETQIISIKKAYNQQVVGKVFLLKNEEKYCVSVNISEDCEKIDFYEQRLTGGPVGPYQLIGKEGHHTIDVVLEYFGINKSELYKFAQKIWELNIEQFFIGCDEYDKTHPQEA